MPRKPCYWTRKLELLLVDFIRKKEFIWKPIGNTNHHIQQKYKAYAEFASKLGRGFTARSVRDRWVNIRSTFNHNLRKVLKSKVCAKSPDEVYTPCWPLWKPLQFLRDATKKDNCSYEEYNSTQEDYKEVDINLESALADINETDILNIRQTGQRTDRPRKKNKSKRNKVNKCKELLDNLLVSMTPFNVSEQSQPYWFFGRHVTERLNAMRPLDAKCAGREILKLLEGTNDEMDYTLGT
ncbi:uncharacterized protein LOC119837381 [Zerene cesonia]|uniref:uncharacterized protein LOC119837381 n=1 Tax=Zerene cesonia TaxID=33412 RepID=UPI0018E5A37A|nr:uncharacterized protein LOC119837381 [Zerene cesonia]